jgi:hypothetical protein
LLSLVTKAEVIGGHEEFRPTASNEESGKRVGEGSEEISSRYFQVAMSDYSPYSQHSFQILTRIQRARLGSENSHIYH